LKKKTLFYLLPVILLFIFVVAGWLATDYLGNKARREIIGESRTSALTLSIYVSSALSTFEGAIQSLAGSPWIYPALLSKGAPDLFNQHRLSNTGATR